MATYYCGARTKTCRKCGHKYPKQEYTLWECPDCGEPRACKRSVAHEGQRCRFHGGKSLGGLAAPAFKTGRHSKYLPVRLAARYEEAVADPELLALRDDIALLDVRLAELLQQLETGESSSKWAKLWGIHGALLAAQMEENEDAAAVGIHDLGQLIQGAGEEKIVWSEIVGLLDQRRKLVEGERKRLVEMRQLLTAEQAMVLLSAVVHVIRENVTDRATLTAISADIKKLVLAEPVGSVGAGG